MFKTNADLQRYVVETFPEVTDSRLNENHWDLKCTVCKMVRGFQLTDRKVATEASEYGGFSLDFYSPVTYVFRCPVCHAFKQWIVYRINVRNDEGKYKNHYYRVTSVPNEGLEEIDELPDNPPSLRTAYRQAIRSKDANANIAAAGMFRRAVQIITRDLLGAKPGNLANELNEVVGKSYNGAAITANFANNGYIIKAAGNQSAHPDRDPDLLDFTPQDAEDLQQIFMEIVSELFIIPAAAKRAKDDFMARRKVTLPANVAKTTP